MAPPRTDTTVFLGEGPRPLPASDRTMMTPSPAATAPPSGVDRTMLAAVDKDAVLAMLAAAPVPPPGADASGPMSLPHPSASASMPQASAHVGVTQPVAQSVQRLAAHQFPHQHAADAVREPVVEGDDVGVLERRGGLDLPHDPRGQGPPVGDDLEREYRAAIARFGAITG